MTLSGADNVKVVSPPVVLEMELRISRLPAVV